MKMTSETRERLLSEHAMDECQACLKDVAWGRHIADMYNLPLVRADRDICTEGGYVEAVTWTCPRCRARNKTRIL